MSDPTWRTGPGTTRHPGPPPAVVAERLAAMARARDGTRAERAAKQRAWLAALGGMSLEDVKRSTPARLWAVAMFHLGGYDLAEIARAIGYASKQSAATALKHPAVQRIIALVRDAQVERVLRGEYGVAAQAKAAAPAVMEHVAELAGARKDKATGERVGRARRDADAIRAADLVLTTSGDKVVRSASYQIHVLEQLSDAELEAFSTRGEWPARLEGIVGALPAPPDGEP
jgi:hypothetical protein